ncbi:hypothetical protein BLNAU_5615 [Blattamonas nauphoetae]|uniref:Uncharacterized protein n=1 Tax=Blattamonas nauphoetae TaxID=2049346 RepID=A0ABQ9Y6B6_9EUKA|nr:hypothetical protein BLNAU_5615 [Blattamonas nauphoetae]
MRENSLLSLLLNSYPQLLINGYASNRSVNGFGQSQRDISAIPTELTAIQSACKLMALALKMSWVEDCDEVSIDPLEPFFNRSLPLTFLGLELLNEIVDTVQFGPGLFSEDENAKTKIAFRDKCLLTCHSLFVTCLSAHVNESIQDVSDAVKCRMLTSSLRLGLKIWSFDFSVIRRAETPENALLNIPESWFFLFYTPALPDLIFRAFNLSTNIPLHRTLSLQLAKQLCLVRGLTFKTVDHETLFVSVYMHYLVPIITTQHGLADHDTFHALCQVIHSLLNLQFRSVIETPLYALFLFPFSSITRRACQFWEWSANSLYYLLAGWNHLSTCAYPSENVLAYQKSVSLKWEQKRKDWEKRETDHEGNILIFQGRGDSPQLSSAHTRQPVVIPPFCLQNNSQNPFNHITILTSPDLPQGTADALNILFISIIYPEATAQKWMQQSTYDWRMCVEEIGQTFMESNEEKNTKRAQGTVSFDTGDIAADEHIINQLGSLLLVPSTTLHTNIIGAANHALQEHLRISEQFSVDPQAFLYSQLSLCTILRLASSYISTLKGPEKTQTMDFTVHLIAVCINALSTEQEVRLQLKSCGMTKYSTGQEENEPIVLMAALSFLKSLQKPVIKDISVSSDEIFQRLSQVCKVSTSVEAQKFCISFAILVIQTTPNVNVAVAAIEFLRSIKENYSTRAIMITMGEVDDLILHHSEEQILTFRIPSPLQLSLHWFLGELIQTDEKLPMWDQFIQPFKEKLQGLLTTVESNNQTGLSPLENISPTDLILFFDSINGLANSITSSDINRRLFSFIAPLLPLVASLFPHIKADDQCTFSVLNLLVTLSTNTQQRLAMGIASAEPVILFQCVAVVAEHVAGVVENILPNANVASLSRTTIDEYTEAYHPLQLILTSVNNIFSGQYVPFAVCLLYQDITLPKLVSTLSKAVLSSHTEHIFFYPDLALQVLHFIYHVLSFTLSSNTLSPPATIIDFLNTTLHALHTLDDRLSFKGCDIVFLIFNHLATTPNSPLASLFTQIEEQNPTLPMTLLRCTSALSLRHPQLDIHRAADAFLYVILTHQREYPVFVDSLLPLVPDEQRGEFLQLMQTDLFANLGNLPSPITRTAFTTNIRKLYKNYRRVFMSLPLPIRLPTITYVG